MDKQKMNWQKIIRNAQKMKNEAEEEKKNVAEPGSDSGSETKNKKFEDLALTFQQKKTSGYRDYHSSSVFSKDSLNFLEKGKGKGNLFPKNLSRKEDNPEAKEKVQENVGVNETSTAKATINGAMKDYLMGQEKEKKPVIQPTARKSLDATINVNTQEYLAQGDDLQQIKKPTIQPTARKSLDATININTQEYLAQDDGLQQIKKPTIQPTARKSIDSTINVNTQEYLGDAKSNSHQPTVNVIRREDAKTVQTPRPDQPEKQVEATPTSSKEDPIGLIGTTLHRKFKIIGFLGQGGMGAVYLGENIRINQKVAIKILIKSAQVQQADIDRFNKEAAIAARIKHNNIVQVYDLDETERFHYIVMEYVEGKSLDAYMRENGILSTEEAVYIIKHATLAFQVIHDYDVVHRDIKPANFMLTNNGEVKIMDFGIVKELGATVEITGTSTIIGTPQFMAPELISKTLIDHRSDIYSLGATFYFLLTGKYCFTGTPMQLMFQVINSKPVPPEEYNPKIPPGISKIIMKMLEKQHIDRYQSMQEVHNALVNFEQEYGL